MFVSFRTSIMVLALLASASVAPAQTARVIPAFVFRTQASSAEPLIALNELPRTVAPTLIDASIEVVPYSEAATPVAGAGESLTEMVGRLRTSAASTRERDCLATAIYFESKSEPLAGQLAVGEVLDNRVKSGRFASSFCGVVLQRGQFSFVRNHTLPSVPRRSLQWKNALAIATIVEGEMMSSKAPHALFFHARSVSPDWHATRVATIGNHVFYR